MKSYDELCKTIIEEWPTDSSKNKSLSIIEELFQELENLVASEQGRCPVRVRVNEQECSNELGAFIWNETEIIEITVYIPKPDNCMKTRDIAEQCLKSYFHESRHAYQHEVINGNIKHNNFEDVEIWRNNFKNYTKSNPDYQAYKDQPVERDACMYADTCLRSLHLRNVI